MSRVRVRVPITGTVGKSISLDPSATEGATIGTNLALPDGTIPTLAELATALGIDSADQSQTPGLANTLWRLIGEIPSDPLSVLGNNTAVSLRPVAIIASADKAVLNRSGSALSFSPIDHTYVSDFDEAAQDAVGGILVDSNSIDFTYNDSTPSITADVKVAYDFPWTGVHTWTRAEPRLIFNESDVGTNLKVWDIDINASIWKIRSRTDADGAGADFLQLVRGTTTTFSSMLIGSTGLTLGTNDANLLYANGGAATFDAHALDTNARFRLRRYNGSLTSSPTEILNNQVLGQHVFQAYSSTAAAIRSPVVFEARATENWASGATGTKWTVTTTGNGSSSASVSLTLQGDQLQSEDGAVTAPAWTFRNDLDSGRYRIGANNIGDAVNGAKVLDISATGLGVTGTIVASGAISGSNLSSSGGANPSASVGLSAVNGSAITFMRSDASPPLDVGISPTWTGSHKFTGTASDSTATTGINIGKTGSIPIIYIIQSTAASNEKGWELYAFGSTLFLDAFNDADTDARHVMTVARSGVAITSLAFGNTTDNPGYEFVGTGQLRGPTGDVSAPGLSFVADTNTGRYRIGADNMGDAVGGNLIVDYSAARVSFKNSVGLNGSTVAGLPVTPAAGDTAYVTNALAPAFGAVVAGGGAVTIPVFYDGANWIVG